MFIIQPNNPFEHIPDELKQRKQWVCWKRMKNRGGKVTKPPIDPRNGKATNGLDPNTWLTFAEAIEYKRNNSNIAGIGIALGNGLSGTDLDNCIKADGSLTSDATEILNLLGATYTEYSPSGRGLHFLHWGKMPNGSSNKNSKMPEMEALEMYETKRYFTVTGRIYGDQAKPILDMTEVMSTICKKHLQKPPVANKKSAKPAPLPTTERGEKEVLDAINRSKSAAQFSLLWLGDTNAYGNDHSRADAALVDMILFHSGGNELLTDQMFRQSGLMREKWDQQHSGDGQTYGQMTIQRIKAGHEAEGKYNWKPNISIPVHTPEKSKMIADKIEELKVIPFEKEQSAFYYSEILPLLPGLPEVERAQAINVLSAILKVPKSVFAKELKNAQPAGKTKNSTPMQLSAVYDEWLECLKGTEYALDNVGNFGYWKQTESGEEVFVSMANFIARPIREIIMDNGQETTLSIEIAGLLNFGYPLPTVQVEASKFSSLAWILGNWGIQANIKSGNAVKDRLRNAIQTLAKHGVRRDTIYTHIGWREINGQWLYLHGGGAIGQGNTGVTVDITDGLGKNELSHYLFSPPQGNIGDAIRTSLGILEVAPPAIVYPLLALVYLSPLCEALKRGAGSEPSFLLWLYGQSGCMKSTLAALCLSHFGAFSNKSFPASFKDTALSIEKKGFVLKDSLMVIDDYYPVTSAKEAQRMEAIAQSIARGWGDRTGRGRLQSDAKMKAGHAPKGMVLVTGEDLPGIGQSGTARMIGLEMKTGDMDTARLTILQNQTESLNHAMYGYIEWLQPQMKNLPERFKEWFNNLRRQTADTKQHARLIEAVIWLYMGFCMLMEYALAYAAISEKQAARYRTAAWNEFLNAAQEQAKATEENSPVTMFINALNEVIMTHTSNLTLVANELYQESIGYYDDEFCYLIPGQAYGAVKAHCDAQGVRFPVSEKMIWKHLKNAGMISVGNDGYSSRQKKINGKNFRYIWLYKKHLELPETADTEIFNQR